MLELGTVLDDSQLDEISYYLSDKLCFDLETHESYASGQIPPCDAKISGYGIHDILDCPHLLEIANDTEILGIAHRYIGRDPLISRVSLRWSYPHAAAPPPLQCFHRDLDDWRFLKLFVYLTDVDLDAGPHVYVRGSHRSPGTFRAKFFSDQEVHRRFGKEQAHPVLGNAGFAFLADTFGVHKGLAPISHPRLVLQIQYSLFPMVDVTYRPHRIGRDRAKNFSPRINRLFLAADRANPKTRAITTTATSISANGRSKGRRSGVS